MDERENSIIELVKKVVPIITELNERLKADDFSYSRIVWDMETLDVKRNKIKADISALEQEVEVKKNQAESIVSLAKEEADKILNFAREKNMEAEKLRAQAKIELEIAVEKRYKKEKVGV